MAAQLDLGQRAFGIYSAGQRAGWSYLAGLRAGQGLFLGAFVNGMPAGAAMVHDMRQCWLGRADQDARASPRVKVAPEYRGGGIGRTLMTELLDAGRRARLPVVGAVPGDDADLPVARLGAGGREIQCTIPARSLRTLAGPDSRRAAAARAPPALWRGPPGIRRAGPDDAAEVIDVIGRSPPGRPRRRAADLGRRPDQAVAGRTGPVLVPGGRRRLRRLPVGR